MIKSHHKKNYMDTTIVIVLIIGVLVISTVLLLVSGIVGGAAFWKKRNSGGQTPGSQPSGSSSSGSNALRSILDKNKCNSPQACALLNAVVNAQSQGPAAVPVGQMGTSTIVNASSSTGTGAAALGSQTINLIDSIGKSNVAIIRTLTNDDINYYKGKGKELLIQKAELQKELSKVNNISDLSTRELQKTVIENNINIINTQLNSYFVEGNPEKDVKSDAPATTALDTFLKSISDNVKALADNTNNALLLTEITTIATIDIPPVIQPGVNTAKNDVEYVIEEYAKSYEKTFRDLERIWNYITTPSVSSNENTKWWTQLPDGLSEKIVYSGEAGYRDAINSGKNVIAIIHPGVFNLISDHIKNQLKSLYESQQIIDGKVGNYLRRKTITPSDDPVQNMRTYLDDITKTISKVESNQSSTTARTCEERYKQLRSVIQSYENYLNGLASNSLFKNLETKKEAIKKLLPKIENKLFRKLLPFNPNSNPVDPNFELFYREGYTITNEGNGPYFNHTCDVPDWKFDYCIVTDQGSNGIIDAYIKDVSRARQPEDGKSPGPSKPTHIRLRFVSDGTWTPLMEFDWRNSLRGECKSKGCRRGVSFKLYSDKAEELKSLVDSKANAQGPVFDRFQIFRRWNPDFQGVDETVKGNVPAVEI